MGETERIERERVERYRIYSHLTRSSFLHVEDALEIGKLRLFAGKYRQGEGANTIAFHFLDLADARVVFTDLAWGRAVDYAEFKGSPGSGGSPSTPSTSLGAGGPQSRVLKVKRDDSGKTWIRLENGPGQVIGQGAIKPAGDPEAVVNIPFSVHESRRLGLAVLAHLRAWEVITFRARVAQIGGEK